MEASLFDLVAQFGFPIVACIAIAYNYNKMVNDNNAKNTEREAQLQQALKESNDTNRILLQTNHELTRTLPEISDKLDTILVNANFQSKKAN